MLFANRSFFPAAFPCCVCIAAGFLAMRQPLSVGHAEPPATESLRRYSDGPLKATEFKAEPPNAGSNDPNARFTGFTETALRWNYRYEITKRTPIVEIRLTEFTMFGIFEANKSWLREKSDPTILDHEQGHFDILEIFVLETKLRIQRLRSDQDAALTATAQTQTEAEKKLYQSLQKLIERERDTLLTMQNAYDRNTRHGNDRGQQMLARRDQLARLEQLRNELK